ncbi:hypothetical protein GXP67_11685 [Rhodocytophaga rosea]|uniref:STAS/SEC14 domain-containing protein n=1 Tax=Rhodocytophaga rosea TaxID=2704465 RepID=A0A6C0GHU1_9BACT|nr:hypothetical protein [Rhodocytophaga rosea]QHT67252.1 hypothetical protein GXP67_11685 [Rhodocytophaga rosea]
MILIHKNGFCKAQYDPSTKTVRTQYIGIANVESITDLLRKVLEFSAKQPIRHMIANLTLMQGTFTGALDFFEKEFYPTMIKNGLETYAMAVSSDVFTHFAATQLKKKVGGKLEWQAFPSVEKAEQWTSSLVKL